MVKTVDYDSRRRSVLAATINKYISEAEPVASEDIAKDFSLSSATIRNIFVELEESGLIMHPYTSGGRMPTQKGYRYYVDFLLSQMELLEEEKEHILKEYKKEIRLLEDTLQKTSEILSTITHYAGIVSFLERQDTFFYRGISQVLDQPEFHNLETMRVLIRMIEEKENLLEIINRDFNQKVKVYIGEELGFPGMENCSLVVCNYRRKDRPLGKIAVLGPVRMEYKHIIPTLEYVALALADVLDGM